MKRIISVFFIILTVVMPGFADSPDADFDLFVESFGQLDLPVSLPSKDITGNSISPELTQKFIDPDYPIKGDRGKGFYSVGAFGLLKKTDAYSAVIVHIKKHIGEWYKLITYTPDGQKINEVTIAKFPASLTSARMLTAAISADGTVNTTGTDEILIEGEGYKDVEMDITYVIMDDGTITTDESTDPGSGARGDSECDEKELARIDEIRFTIAHQLIDAKTVNAVTDGGTQLTAFYVGDDLVKLSVDAKGFMQEIYVSKGFPVSFDVTDFGSGYSVTDTYYFKDYRLVCRINPISGEEFGPPDEPETDLIAGFEYYLNAIQ